MNRRRKNHFRTRRKRAGAVRDVASRKVYRSRKWKFKSSSVSRPRILSSAFPPRPSDWSFSHSLSVCFLSSSQSSLHCAIFVIFKWTLCSHGLEIRDEYQSRPLCPAENEFSRTRTWKKNRTHRRCWSNDHRESSPSPFFPPSRAFAPFYFRSCFFSFPALLFGFVTVFLTTGFLGLLVCMPECLLLLHVRISSFHPSVLIESVEHCSSRLNSVYPLRGAKFRRWKFV